MADVSVRPARPDDAADIGRIQVETWRTAYTAVVPLQALSELDPARAAATWRAEIESPTSERHHVLVALEQDWLVGFAATGPGEDDGAGEIAILLVEPRWGRRGHGSRLLAAVVDHWRDDGFGRGVVWIPESDEASAAFYTSAGWARDGFVRGLEAGTETLREVRLHTALGDE